MAKLVPSPVQVAPSGLGTPGNTTAGSAPMVPINDTPKGRSLPVRSAGTFSNSPLVWRVQQTHESCRDLRGVRLSAFGAGERTSPPTPSPSQWRGAVAERRFRIWAVDGLVWCVWERRFAATPITLVGWRAERECPGRARTRGPPG